MAHEHSEPVPRVRRQVKAEFDRFDLSRELLEIGFRCSKEDGTLARLEPVATDAPPDAGHKMLVDNKDALLRDGFKTVWFNGRTFRLADLTTVEAIKEQIRREREEGERAARAAKEERAKLFIYGTADETEADITRNLQPHLPRGARLVFAETEKSVAGHELEGTDQYRGCLTLTLASDDGRPKRILATYYSPWKNESASGGGIYHTDYGNPHKYELGREATINSLIKSLQET